MIKIQSRKVNQIIDCLGSKELPLRCMTSPPLIPLSQGSGGREAPPSLGRGLGIGMLSQWK